jgi:hypothetical protein
VCLAEQNNGYILQNLMKILFRRRATASVRLDQIMAINTLDPAGRPHFIHSGTYEELTEAFGLTPARIARALSTRLAAGESHSPV